MADTVVHKHIIFTAECRIGFRYFSVYVRLLGLVLQKI